MSIWDVARKRAADALKRSRAYAANVKKRQDKARADRLRQQKAAAAKRYTANIRKKQAKAAADRARAARARAAKSAREKAARDAINAAKVAASKAVARAAKLAAQRRVVETKPVSLTAVLVSPTGRPVPTGAVVDTYLKLKDYLKTQQFVTIETTKKPQFQLDTTPIAAAAQVKQIEKSIALDNATIATATDPGSALPPGTTILDMRVKWAEENSKAISEGTQQPPPFNTAAVNTQISASQSGLLPKTVIQSGEKPKISARTATLIASAATSLGAKTAVPILTGAAFGLFLQSLREAQEPPTPFTPLPTTPTLPTLPTTPTLPTLPTTPFTPTPVCNIGETQKGSCLGGIDIITHTCKKDPITGFNRWEPTGEPCPAPQLGKSAKILITNDRIEAFEGMDITITAGVMAGSSPSTGEIAILHIDGSEVARSRTANGFVSFKWTASTYPSRSHKVCVIVPKSVQYPQFGPAKSCEPLIVSRKIPGIEAQLKAEREQFLSQMRLLRQERARIRQLSEPTPISTPQLQYALPIAAPTPPPPIPTPTPPPTPIVAPIKPGVIIIPSIGTPLKVVISPDIYIDGKFFGPAPISAELEAGKHTIKVELKNHTPIQKSITVAEGETKTISDLRFI